MTMTEKSELDLVRYGMKQNLTLAEIKDLLGEGYSLEDVAALQLKVLHDKPAKRAKYKKSVNKRPINKSATSYTVFALIKEKFPDLQFPSIVDLNNSEDNYVYRYFRESFTALKIQPSQFSRELVTRTDGTQAHRVCHIYNLTPEQKISIFEMVDRKIADKELAKDYEKLSHVVALMSGAEDVIHISKTNLSSVFFSADNDGKQKVAHLLKIGNLLQKLKYNYTTIGKTKYYEIDLDKFVTIAKALKDDADYIFYLDEFLNALERRKSQDELDSFIPVTNIESSVDWAKLKKAAEPKQTSDGKFWLLFALSMFTMSIFGVILGMFLMSKLG